VNRPLHVGLFLGSCGTTFFAGRYLLGAEVSDAALYAFVLMLTLLCHELGHFLMARAHGVDASWPYFIPLPMGFGTLGAVIRLKGRIPNRNALVDIGAAGPLAGLLIAVPMLFVGVHLSHVEQLPSSFSQSALPPPLSLINLASMAGLYVKHLLFETPMPELPQYELFGDNLLTLLAVRVVHGEIPAGSDLMAHPVFLAAWFGLVMTMLNLLPVGQLDGGHLTHAWYGERAERIGERVAAGALIMALFCSMSWLVWFFLITRLVGVKHPPVARPEEPLSTGRKVVVVVTWVLTGLTFMPIPLSLG
jgi:membrane-associated protease RseP (regulator of RpoE activity)